MNPHNLPDLDCAVCLQKCHHPAQLPCGHIFCFLCVKGVAIQNRKCAMCRTEIPSNYFDSPKLLLDLSQETQSDGEYQWYYEGRNGWWKYDERSNIDLEAAYNSGKNECTLLLAGALYGIDFQNMVQIRRSDPTRRRQVKRDTPTLPAKGVAGIKIIGSNQIKKGSSNTEEAVNINTDISNDSDAETTETHSVESSANVITSEEDISELLSVLRVDDSEESAHENTA